jgi:predicted  nucleic acid-binding Zn-ribbon protein
VLAFEMPLDSGTGLEQHIVNIIPNSVNTTETDGNNFVVTFQVEAESKIYDFTDEGTEAIIEEIKAEQEKWDNEKKAAAQAKRDYAKIEAERNRQMKRFEELNKKLELLKQGKRPETETKEVAKDTPEIENVKAQIKLESEKLSNIEKQQKRIQDLETELQRLKDRKPKEEKETTLREVSDREKELRELIEAEKEKKSLHMN